MKTLIRLLLLMPLLVELPARGQENPAFAPALAQVDQGGDLMVYINARKMVEAAGSLLTDVEAMLASAMEGQETPLPVTQAFQWLRDGVKHLGLTGMGDVALSSRQLGPERFRKRIFIGKRDAQVAGLMWKPPTPADAGFPGLDWVPIDALMAGGLRPDPARFLTACIEVLRGTPAEPVLANALTDLKEQLGVDLPALLGSLDGEAAFAITLNRAQLFPLPDPVGPVPTPSLMAAIKLRNASLSSFIESRLMESGAPLGKMEMDDLSLSILTLTNAPPMVMPCWTVTADGWWLIGSQPSAIRQLLQARSGGAAASLASNAEFAGYARDVPAAVDSFGYISREVGEFYMDIMGRVMTAMVPQSTETMQRMARRSAEQMGQLAVWECLPSGYRMTSVQRADDLGTTLAVITTVPVGIGAALVIPNVMLARERALKIKCLNNLRQIEMMVGMARVDHPNHEGPVTWTMLEDYLPNAERDALACPKGGEYQLPDQPGQRPSCTHPGHGPE